MSTRPARRSQAQRRSQTVARIIEATVDCLIEQGYAGSSTIRIAREAGLSQGALFRHFPTRSALMIAVAQHIGDGLLQRFREDFQAWEGREDPVRLALTLLRRNCHERIHQAWFELQIAGRSDPELQAALAPIWQRNLEVTQSLAAQILPELATLSADFPVIVDLMVSLFRGEALDGCLNADRRQNTARIDMAHRICQLLEDHYRQAAPTGRAATPSALERRDAL